MQVEEVKPTPAVNILSNNSADGIKAPPVTTTTTLSSADKRSSFENFQHPTQHFLSRLLSTTSRSNNRKKSAKLIEDVPETPFRKFFTAYVVNVDSIKIGSKRYVVYKILVTSGLLQWVVSKRYSEVIEFYRSLLKKYHKYAKLIPYFQHKKMFSTGFTINVVTKRKERINSFLTGLANLHWLQNEEPFISFFANEQDVSSSISKSSTLIGTTATQLLSQFAPKKELDEESNSPDKYISLDLKAGSGNDENKSSESTISSVKSPLKIKRRSILVEQNSKRVINSFTKKMVAKRQATKSLHETSPRTSFSIDDPASATHNRHEHPNMTETKSELTTNIFSFIPNKKVNNERLPNFRVTIDDFVLLKLIGTGSYGKVMMARHKVTGAILAVKAISKKQLLNQPKEIARVMSERSVLKQALEHPFLVTLRYSFQTSEKLYFCIDYINGGELFFHLQNEKKFTEDRTRFYACEILLALEYLHKKDIVYRDLKPENCMIDELGHIRIIDFGMATELSSKFNRKLHSICGTPEYMAPEVLKEESYDHTLDWYCFGAVVYEMLVGAPPYYSREKTDMFDRILHSQLRFSSSVSPVARNLISSLLERDPTKRLGSGPSGCEDIKTHPFFEDIVWDDVLNKKIKPPFIPKVSGMFDLDNVDPVFHSQPLPASVENDGKISAFPSDVQPTLDHHVINLIQDLKLSVDPDVEGSTIDFSQQFFASNSRFKLAQSRSANSELSIPSSRALSPLPPTDLSQPTASSDPDIEALTKAFQDFAYVNPDNSS